VDKNTIFTRVILHLCRKLRNTERKRGGRGGGRRAGGRERERERERVREQLEGERGQKRYFTLRRSAKKWASTLVKCKCP